MALFFVWSGDKSDFVRQISPEMIQTIPSWSQDMEWFGPWISVNEGMNLYPGTWWQGKQSSGTPHILICGPCASTNVVGWYFLEQGLFAPWDSFLAVSQWAGRGHKGRRWRSPEGNLFVSFVGPPFQRDLGIFPSVLFGFIVVQSLRFLGVRTSLKWPNDLIFNDAKLGGILIQERPEQFLVGIGINLRTLPQEAQEIHDPALEPGCLDPSPYPEWGPLRWWAALVHQMIVWYEHILLWGEEALCSRIEDCLAFKERKVWVLSDYDVPYLARVKGLDSNGRLRVCRAGRLKTLQQERIFPKD